MTRNMPAMATSKHKDPSIPPQHRRCPILNSTPREIRDLIYTFVLPPAPRVLLRDQQPKKRYRCRGTHLLQPTFRLGAGRLGSKSRITWEKCLMGVLLVSKQFSREVLEVVYPRVRFVFETPEQGTAFLRIVPRMRLETIRNLETKYVGFHCTWEPEFVVERSRVVRMWSHIVGALPNVESLRLEVDPPFDGKYALDCVCPSFNWGDEEEPEIKDFEALQWVQDVKIFRVLKRAQHIHVKLTVHNYQDELIGLWRGMKFYAPQGPYATQDEAQGVVAARWAEWYKALHRSMGIALEKLIRNEDDPWRVHLDHLQRYYVWRRDPHQLTGLFRNPAGHKIKFNGTETYA